MLRTSPLVGRKAWFGPRRLGWGLGPVTPEGWAFTIVCAALGLAIRRWSPDSRKARYALFTGFVLCVLLKGSAPGGAGARAEFDAARAASREGVP
jgi:hypothetical protein